MKLTAKSGKKDKIHISIDGVYQTTVDALYFSTCGYRDGDELSAEQVETFLRDANARRAFNKAAGLLSYQDRTRKQLVDRLKEDYGEDGELSAPGHADPDAGVDDEHAGH